MNNYIYGFLCIAVCAAVTMFIRALPFLVFGNRKMPAVVEYLGKFLSGAIMAILIIFCLKDTDIKSPPYGIPEFLCAAVCGGLHIWKNNTILSIAVSTVLYIILTRFIFI